jgi:hypothetical protein
MALWSNKTVQVPGLASVYASTGPITAESRRHYILDTTSNTIVVNLPIGIDGTTIRISDAKGTFLTNNVTVNPASGEKINNLTTNEPLILDANEMWIEFTWNASAGSWIVNAPGILALITDTYTDYPYITSPSSPATSTLRLYAKSDGKLYTKDSSGSEKKVGGGLDHPTTGSTFEVDSYNASMTGQYNTGIGYLAGVSITSGSENTVLGLSAGQQITTGGSNTLIGSGAGLYISANGSNTAVGRNSFRSYGTVSNSTAIGSSAGFYAQGSGHTLIGSNADSYTDSGSYNNTAIGKETGIQTSSTGVSGTVCIGIDSSGNAAVATSSNQFVLGAINHKYRFPGVVETSLVLGPTGTLTGQTGELRFRELVANGTHSVGLKAADLIAADVTWTLPSADGTSGQALVTNGSGVLSFSSIVAKSGDSMTGALTMNAQNQIRFADSDSSNYVGFQAPATISTNRIWTLPSADGINGQALTTNGSGTLSWAPAGNTIVLVTQNTHGFTAADVGRPLYLSGSTYTYARADLEATAEVAGLIYSIIDTNTFQICLGGEVTSVGANLVDGGGSLAAGEVYFLSPTTAGKITTTPPSVVGQISKPIGVARTTTALDFYNMRGSAVGGSNVYTQISLANAVATTIQNASAYNAVELVGFIYINATTPYRFTFKAQVTKKGDATDYLISYQTSGDTPPVGFNISVTTGGLVQVTLPSVAGFTSAIAQFSLNGPAVGVSLPLQIQSSLLTLNAGIQFPATMIASSDPNNLDDYEEGVFAPSFYGSSTAGTWTPNATQTGGYYIKIGKLVYLFINLNGTMSGAAGELRIGNLPHPRAASNAGNAWNATYSAFTMAYGNGLTWTAGHYCSGWLINPSNFLYGHTMPTGGGTAGVINVTNGVLNVHIAGAYYTD